MTRDQLTKTRTLLHDLATHIPSVLAGADRQRFISKRLLAGLPTEDLATLRGFMNECLSEMRRRDASDIDMGGWGAGGRIWLRVHGSKTPADDLGKYRDDEIAVLIQSLLTDSQREALIEDRNLDFSYIYRNGGPAPLRHRADAYFDLDALALNVRAITQELRPFESYRFHPNVARMLSLEHSKDGLVLVTGITGSGKSTTLDAIIEMNNATVNGHVVIIASPVEYVHESQSCLIRHREVGRDTRTFKSGTIEALRQDPDIIVLGEMRDPDTIMSALEAADSGHKVLSTLHTSSAIESIDRIIGEMPSVEQGRVRNRLGDVLRCVISQKLVPSADGKRVLAKEILLLNAASKAAIKMDNVGEVYQMMTEGGPHGMLTMEQDLRGLVHSGWISRETAMAHANNKRVMQQLLTHT